KGAGAVRRLILLRGYLYRQRLDGPVARNTSKDRGGRPSGEGHLESPELRSVSLADLRVPAGGRGRRNSDGRRSPGSAGNASAFHREMGAGIQGRARSQDRVGGVLSDVWAAHALLPGARETRGSRADASYNRIRPL